MRTQFLTGSLGIMLAFGLAACGDDDGGNNVNNQNNNNSVVICGDGVAAGIETCDGADLRSNNCASIGQGFTDGTLACNAFCDGWDTNACTGGATCGDDTAEGGELCDGADLDSQDCTTIGQGFTGGTLACNNDCMSWNIAACIGGATCGDNTAEGNELCDGADLDSNDCTTIGMGFIGGTLDCNGTCDGWITTGCTSPTCGDGNVEGNELCDGANLDSNDCTTIGMGFTGGTLTCNGTCDGWITAACTGGSTCGNDTVEGNELCDLTDLDGFSCTTIGQGFTGGTLACNGTCDDWVTTACTGGGAVCGDGNIDAGEDCDGANLGSDDCTTIGGGYTGGTLYCNPSCAWDVTQCTGGTSTCGNNTVEPGEACDGNDLNGYDCAAVGPFNGGALACNANCQWFDYSACTLTNPVCGNGVQEGVEQCDGNDLGGITCAAFGFTSGTAVCDANCQFDISGCNSGITGWTCNPGYYGGSDGCDCGCGIIDPDCSGDLTAGACDYCGDFGSCAQGNLCPGFINPANNVQCTGATATCGDNAAEGGEQCDGQDLRNHDCTTLEQGFSGGTLACTAGCQYNFSQCIDAVCGNNAQEGFEHCDGQDLQSATCVDLGYLGGTLDCDTSCQFDTSQCTDPVCGDGVVEGAEECDDSNTNSGDGCDANCMIEWAVATETEPNDAYTTANGPYTVSTQITAAVGVAGDFDYFAVTVPAGGTLTAEVTDGGTGDCAGFVIDSEVEIYDTDGTTSLLFNDDTVNDFCSLASLTGLPAGTYYVRAAASQVWTPNDTFSYVLNITVY